MNKQEVINKFKKETGYDIDLDINPDDTEKSKRIKKKLNNSLKGIIQERDYYIIQKALLIALDDIKPLSKQKQELVKKVSELKSKSKTKSTIKTKKEFEESLPLPVKKELEKLKNIKIPKELKETKEVKKVGKVLKGSQEAKDKMAKVRQGLKKSLCT